MPKSPVLWSARACPFRRAGVYYGLSRAETHVPVAQRLLPRRGVPYPPRTMSIREHLAVPLVYFAVRDPSAVRVVPVRGNGGADEPGDGGGHVFLIFPAARRVRAADNAPELRAISKVGGNGSQAG